MTRPYNMSKRQNAAEQTRERIVSAALVVFDRVGFRHGSIQAIGREAGVSPATVLNHFENPEAIVRAATAHLQAALGFPSVAQIQQAGDLEARVAIVVSALHRCYDET